MSVPQNGVGRLPQAVVERFSMDFGEAPGLVVRAPGRVNLIGEHTDYNDGYVLPLAIERAVWIALRPRTDRTVRVRSLDFGELATFDPANIERGEESWLEYVKGTAWALQDAGLPLGGWEGVMAGNVPIGAGLSSSAALELATARAFASVSKLTWDPAKMALLCQRAENEWVGVKCGIMDQMISAAGVEGHAVLIDCRTLETTAVPFPPETAVVIMDTTTRRGLVDSAYNERRQQCEAGARIMGVPALRDVSSDALARRIHELEPVTARRVRHVVTENERTLHAAEAMRHGDASAVGELMNQSHSSLRDDFEVSSPELDAIVAAAQAQPQCYGARMTGAGFGGCAVALVKRSHAQSFADAVAEKYTSVTGLDPQLYITGATAGARILAADEYSDS